MGDGSTDFQNARRRGRPQDPRRNPGNPEALRDLSGACRSLLALEVNPKGPDEHYRPREG